MQIAQILANQPFRLTSLVLHPEAHFSGNRNSLNYTCLCVKKQPKIKGFKPIFTCFTLRLCSIYSAYIQHTMNTWIFVKLDDLNFALLCTLHKMTILCNKFVTIPKAKYRAVFHLGIIKCLHNMQTADVFMLLVNIQIICQRKIFILCVDPHDHFRISFVEKSIWYLQKLSW